MSEKERISVMQNNLSTIRHVLQWTAGELGDKIGVTRQTISNLERGRTRMSKTQYLAFRTVLAGEVATRNDKALGRLVGALIGEAI